MMDPWHNLFLIAALECPRCFHRMPLHDDFSVTGGRNAGVWIAFDCGRCKDNSQVAAGGNNAVLSAQLDCPRCIQVVTIDRFHLTGGEGGAVYLTFGCPKCTDVSQVSMREPSFKRFIERIQPGLEKG